MMFANPNWSDNYTDFLPSGVAGLALAMGLTFIAFEGYEIISQAGDEIRNPKKKLLLLQARTSGILFYQKIRVENVLNTSNIPQIDGNSVKQEGDVENV